jgi:hypothetical protein
VNDEGQKKQRRTNKHPQVLFKACGAGTPAREKSEGQPNGSSTRCTLNSSASVFIAARGKPSY